MKIWAFSLALLWAASGHCGNVTIDVWQLDCSQAPEGSIRAALMGASLVLEPCHISLKLGNFQALPGGAACDMPLSAAERAPILASLTKAARHSNPRGLSLFILPVEQRAGGDTRLSWAFSLVEKSKQALCGDPEPRFLERFGSLFMTDLGRLCGPRPEFYAPPCSWPMRSCTS